LIQDQSIPSIKQRYELIADHLIAEMRRGALGPGDRLPAERELALRLGVGRASVREALGFLQVSELIATRPGAGSYVVEDIAERVGALNVAGPEPVADASPSAVLEARLSVEPAIARLAAQGAASDSEVARLLDVMAGSADPLDPDQRRRWSEADRLFHREIAVMTENPLLVGMADLLARTMDEPLWRRLRDDAISAPGRTTLQLAEHRLIHAAIAEGDPGAAELHARQHIERARRYMALD
jgi:DNA-binding FadR family transcriptional regulator